MSPSIVLENSKWLEDLTGKGKALSPRGEGQSLLADFGRGGARGYCCFCLLPCEIEKNRRDLKLHFLSRVNECDGRGLDEVHRIVPGIDVNAAAERKRGNLVFLCPFQF